jgi:hypothetical protein
MPRLAVNMLVLNGASVLRRCFHNLKGIVDELVVVDTGSTDGTQKVLEEISHELGVDRFYYDRLHPFGEDFFTDEATSFRMEMPGPFTGRRVCSDWAKARNLALDNTTADYVLKLDADDEVVSPPENLLRTLDYLDVKPDVDLVSAPYEIYDGKGSLEWLSMYARLWRRGRLYKAGESLPSITELSSKIIRWTQPLHEYLAPVFPERTLFSVQGLRVRDHRDSPGEGVRLAHRNLKVLLRAWENGDRKTISAPEDLRRDHLFRFTLAHEAAEVFPAWSREKLVTVMARLAPDEASMLSDCHYHVGRSHESEGNLPAAREAYLAADETAPHTQALLRALQVAERMKDFESCGRLRKQILTRTGMGADDPLPFNCDLKLLVKLRLQLGMYGTLLFNASYVVSEKEKEGETRG